MKKIILLTLCSVVFARGHAQDKQGTYTVLPNKPEQYIWGLGFEIQSDGIGSQNNGLPEKITGIPHDLVPAERTRLYQDMLKGFRYCRIAGGLYLRGTTPDQKQLRGRWDTQMAEIRELIDRSGVEGTSLEYWSPTPYWKANGKYTGRDSTVNKLKCFGPDFKNDPVYKGDTLAFLKDMGESLVKDIMYLRRNGIRVQYWGLQNEPPADTPYSSCLYTPDEYYLAFKTIAPMIKAYDPNIAIIADSWEGPTLHSKKIAADPLARQYVDAWVWHQIGYNSNSVITKQPIYLADTYGKPVYQNEYEYLEGKTSPDRCLNTVQNLMNWFVFVNSPTWYWIHALKPTYNEEASGYSLGFWRPQDDEQTADLKKGYWKYNPNNYNAMAGFLKYMPWDSRRYAVIEDKVRNDNRIFAFKTPEGKLVVVISNRSGADFTFQINTGKPGTFRRMRYTPEQAGAGNLGKNMGDLRGEKLSVTLPHLTWEFLVEQ